MSKIPIDSDYIVWRGTKCNHLRGLDDFSEGCEGFEPVYTTDKDGSPDLFAQEVRASYEARGSKAPDMVPSVRFEFCPLCGVKL